MTLKNTVYWHRHCRCCVQITLVSRQHMKCVSRVCSSRTHRTIRIIFVYAGWVLWLGRIRVPSQYGTHTFLYHVFVHDSIAGTTTLRHRIQTGTHNHMARFFVFGRDRDEM